MATFATRTHKLSIERLKGICGLDEISFEDRPLTGVFGPNGVGKSTVLHALAAAYKTPKGTASNYKQFFPPLAADVWNGTRFVIDHTFLTGKTEARGEVEYRKGTATTDWTPDVPDRPLRYLSYVGVKSCLPDLEAYDSHDLTKAVATAWTSDIDVRVREAAGGILNCRYTAMASLAISGEPDKKYTSLTREEWNGQRLDYPSVVMGAGEQRLLRLLYAVEESHDGGLILVDELDLLLHGVALKNLIKHLHDRCQAKRLQLVFTSHREELLALKDHINIRHVWAQGGKHRCFSNTDPDSLGRLSGHQTKTLEVFVEDDLGAAVVSHVASELGMSRHVRIIAFGAAKNCFTVFAGLLIKGESCENSCFILDGDEYETAAKKQEQVNAACSGNDEAARLRREKIANKTRDFVLPAGVKPERFIHGLIITQDPQNMSATEKEIQQLAAGIVNPMDMHDFVDKVVETLGDNRAAQLARLIPLAAKKDAEWKAYTQPVRDWLVERKGTLDLP
jgi:energy-coupling factor transporter ATP-binding protein EcfA2